MVTGDVALNITHTTTGVAGIQTGSDQVQHSTTEMFTHAGQLKAMVADFKMCKGKSVVLGDPEPNTDGEE